MLKQEIITAHNIAMLKAEAIAVRKKILLNKKINKTSNCSTCN